MPGTQLGSVNGFSAAPRTALSARDSASTTTRSGVSGATVTITDEARQQALTGRDVATTVATLNRDVTTGRDTSGALKPIFNEQEIQAGFAISGAFAREAGNFLALRSKDADLKGELAKKAEAQAADLRFKDQRQALSDRAAALRAEAQAINETWGPGTTNRQVLSALVAAASGNVSGSTGAFIQAGVVNFVQQQGAAYVGTLVAQGSLIDGSPEHAALHAIVACAGAAASSQSCGAGALGAATSSLLTNLFKEPGPNETARQREAKGNIINALVAGTALVLGGTAAEQIATVVTASDAAIQNNYLTQRELVQKREALVKCKGNECQQIEKDFQKISTDRKARQELACLASPTQCRGNTVEVREVMGDLAEYVSRLPDGSDKREATRNLAQAISDYKNNLAQLENYGNNDLRRIATPEELARLGYLTPKEAADLTAFKTGQFVEIFTKAGEVVLVTALACIIHESCGSLLSGR